MTLALFFLDKITIIPVLLWVLCSTPFQSVQTSVTIFVIVLLMVSEKIRSVLPVVVNNIFDAFKAPLSGKAAEFGSDVSYSVYLIHMIVMPGVVSLTIQFSPFDKLATAGMAVALFLAANVLISYLLFMYVEKPFMKIGKNLLKKNANRVVVAEV